MVISCLLISTQIENTITAQKSRILPLGTTFSKIKCNPQTYKPSKQTAVAFAIALKLNLEETQDLLASAGMTLSRAFVFDKIIRYFIQKEIICYDKDYNIDYFNFHYSLSFVYCLVSYRIWKLWDLNWRIEL